VEIQTSEWEQGQSYLAAYEILIGDERTRRTFNGMIYGIIRVHPLFIVYN